MFGEWCTGLNEGDSVGGGGRGGGWTRDIVTTVSGVAARA